MKTLYFASANQGKTRELRKLLAPYAQVQDLNDLKVPVEWEETGDTFLENALIKARALSARLEGGAILAEDSGLCVDALGGEPGVYSARWSGVGASDVVNCEKLLQALAEVPRERRTAHFVCSLVYIDAQKREHCVEGLLNGHIALSLRGASGFGYDPLFIPEGYKQTLGELSLEVKNGISHRYRALQKLLPFLS